MRRHKGRKVSVIVQYPGGAEIVYVVANKIDEVVMKAITTGGRVVSIDGRPAQLIHDGGRANDDKAQTL